MKWWPTFKNKHYDNTFLKYVILCSAFINHEHIILKSNAITLPVAKKRLVVEKHVFQGWSIRLFLI